MAWYPGKHFDTMVKVTEDNLQGEALGILRQVLRDAKLSCLVNVNLDARFALGGQGEGDGDQLLISQRDCAFRVHVAHEIGECFFRRRRAAGFKVRRRSAALRVSIRLTTRKLLFLGYRLPYLTRRCRIW